MLAAAALWAGLGGVGAKESSPLRSWNTSYGPSAADGNSTAALCELFFERLARATVDPPRRFGTCAVAALHASFGLEAAIDAHDAVIRFNGAPIENFAGDVGRRTTVWVVAGMHLIQPARQASAAGCALLLERLARLMPLRLLAARRKISSVMLINPQLASDTAALRLMGDGPASRVSANGRTRPSVA